MKLAFIVFTILINFFNQALIKSEEQKYSSNNKIENLSKEKSLNTDKSEIKTIHIVKVGDTISSISKLYSINKDSIIKWNNLKDENYIYVGQNLFISNANENALRNKGLNNQEMNKYHIVQKGENLTDISNKYKLKLKFLIEINNLNNPDTIKVGEKLLLSKNNPSSTKNYQKMEAKKNKEFLNLDQKTYGPIIIQSKSVEKVNGRKVLNVLNRNNKKLILSISCETKELDVRIPGRKWSGWEPAKKEFEKNLINDLC